LSASPNWRAVAIAAARAYGINPSIFTRQINQESGFNPNARSSAGAEGIAQFMPGTAAGMHINPLDPRQALFAAAKMDSGNLAKYGSWAQALSAYNSGRANAYLDPSFAGGQTTRYVQDILGGKNNEGGGLGTLELPPTSDGKGGLGPLRSTLGPGLGMSAQEILASQLLGNQAMSLVNGGSPLQIMQDAQLQSALQQNGGPLQIPQVPLPNNSVFPAARMHGTKAGGFLSGGFPYKAGRLDQGHDFQTSPGAPIIAPGDGVVVSVRSDPHGFGPAYPIVHFTTGPYAGKNVYIGHTLAQVRPGQRFQQGQVLSHTGSQPVGNAAVPGWAEIGFAPSGLPGPDGQQVPF
jgi:murein DD-endopeptidase MepM/ murein hydrolase activator NlpD